MCFYLKSVLFCSTALHLMGRKKKGNWLYIFVATIWLLSQFTIALSRHWLLISMTITKKSSLPINANKANFSFGFVIRHVSARAQSFFSLRCYSRKLTAVYRNDTYFYTITAYFIYINNFYTLLAKNAYLRLTDLQTYGFL